MFIDLWQKTIEIRRQDELLKAQEIATLERESESRYRSLADAVPQIVWTIRFARMARRRSWWTR